MAARRALALEQVGPVDRGRGDLEEHLAGPGLRVGLLGDGQDVGASGLRMMTARIPPP